MTNFQTIISSPQLDTIYKSAEAYCSFIETEKAEGEEFLEAVRAHLFNIYNSALQLPDIEFDFESIEDFPGVDYENTVAMISGKLKKQFYWHVFDPTNESDKEPVGGDLVDDLADIYKDLKTSLNLFNSGLKDCRQNAVWQFKFEFKNHWGDHCINAIYAIHYFLQKY